MHIKKYYGSTVQEAMQKAKKELGNEAIILSTKKVKKGGFLGFFQKEEVEILVAIEKKEVSKKNEQVLENEFKKQLNSTGVEYVKSQREYKKDIDDENINSSKEDKIEVKKELENIDLIKNTKEIRSNKFSNNSNNTTNEDLNVNDFKKEIDDLKGLISKINTKVDIKVSTDEGLKNKFEQFYTFLKSRGISNEIIDEILSLIDDVNIEFSEFEKIAYSYIVDKFKSSQEFKFTKKVNIFVGATGVGKTTTLAKIASNTILQENKKIGFLTLDTYRVSAVNQLKVYADILSVPIEVAYELSDIDYALGKLNNRDLIFVDTAGRSHKNKKHMNELKKLVDSFEEKDIFLVISANYHEDDIKSLIEEYSFLQSYNIIVTKLDETNRIGVVLEILNSSCNKIIYTTFGQNVPDDIEPFDIGKIANEVLRR